MRRHDPRLGRIKKCSVAVAPATERAGHSAYITATKACNHNINQYHIDKYTEYKPVFLDKIKAVAQIIANYRYDDSNSMVDYFDANFYYNISVKIKEA